MKLGQGVDGTTCATSSPAPSPTNFDRRIFCCSSTYPQYQPGLHEVTISTTESVELTIVVGPGTPNPTFAVASGSFSGTWETMLEGTAQFSGTPYYLTGVPSNLIGLPFWRGPKDSGVMSVKLTVKRSTPVYVLASLGNTAASRNGISIAGNPSATSVLTSMSTSAFTTTCTRSAASVLGHSDCTSLSDEVACSAQVRCGIWDRE